ncbi:MAG: hypothetical protein ACRCT1_00720 [Microcoleaceae cyanobacterium]
MTSGELPNGVKLGELPKVVTLGELPNGVKLGELPKVVTSGELPKGVKLGELPNGVTSGELPNGVTSGELPNGVTSGELPDDEIWGDVPDWLLLGVTSGNVPACSVVAMIIYLVNEKRNEPYLLSYCIRLADSGIPPKWTNEHLKRWNL